MMFATATEKELSDIANDVSRIEQLLNSIYDKTISFGIRVIIAIIIFLVGRFIIKKILKIVDNIFKRSSIDSSVSKFIYSFLNVILYVILVIILCKQVGIDTTSFVAILASGGLAVGLAFEGSLSNFAGGILILLMKPFKIGDYIVSNGVEGVVEKIDIFYTSLNTVDNKSVKLPNGILSNSILTNYSMNNARRVDVECGIGYNDNIKDAKKIFEDVMYSYPRILKDRDNTVVVKKLGENSIVLEIRMWVNSEDYWDGVFFVNENLKIALDEAGIIIPFNQLDVHIIDK